MALQYSGKIITDGLIMCLDPSQNTSLPIIDLPVKDNLVMWLDASDDTTFTYSSGTVVSQWRDKSGNNFHASQGTVASQPSRSTTQNSRKTVNFDGTNDTVTIPNFICNSEMSIFVVSNCGTSLFIEHSTDTNSNSGFYLGGQGTGMFAINRSPGIIFINNTNWLSGGYSIASAVNSTGLDMLTYKNGTQQSLTLDGRASRSNSYTTATLYIGSRGANSLWSSGPIAEIIIYNRKVTNKERNLIHTYLGIKWDILNTDRSVSDLSNNFTGLLGDGTVANMPNYSYYNKSFRFDGVNDIITYQNNIGTLSNYSFAFWARHEANSKMPISTYGATNFYWYGDNSWAYTHGGVFGEKYYNKAQSIPLGSWGHYCVTYDGSKVQIYRNGVYEDQQSTTGSANFSLGLQFGKYGTSTAYMLLGNMGSILMYNKALTATEVDQLYQKDKYKYLNSFIENSLVLNLDAGNPFSYAQTGSIWYDTSGNRYNGTLTNGPVYSNTNGGAIIFDGSNDYVDLTSTTSSISGNAARSVFCWMKTTQGGLIGFVSLGTPANSQAFNLVKYSNNVGIMGYNNDYYPTSGNSGKNIIDGNWHYIGAVYNGSGTLTTYVDGVLDNQVGAISYSTTGQNNYIGRSNHVGNENFLNGSIGSVQIYNIELSAAQVLQNYNATKGRFGL